MRSIFLENAPADTWLLVLDDGRVVDTETHVWVGGAGIELADELAMKLTLMVEDASIIRTGDGVPLYFELGDVIVPWHRVSEILPPGVRP